MNSKFIISFCLSTLLLTSCNEDKKMSTLNESEIFFEETLSSISKDGIDENIFYVGTEDGIVYIYNSSNQQLKRVNTEFDRIYKVVKDTTFREKPVYWVGTRNMGLFCCELKDSSFVIKERHGRYYIPVKATKYSAYDIFVHKSGVYVATSHGLFKVPNDKCSNDTLKILGPKSYKDKLEKLRPVVSCSFQLYKDKYLFCASDSGLFRVTLSSDEVSTHLSQKRIMNIVLRQNEVYCLVEDSVIVVDYDGNRIPDKSFRLKHPAQIYYYDETDGVNYFISNHFIQLVKDADLYNPDRFKQVQTRRSIRTKCHNVIENDSHHSQSLLVTNHAVLRIGHHQDVLNSFGDVTLTCTDKEYLYYLIGGTKLYRQNKDKKVAYLYKEITGGTKDIRLMEVLNDVLYYVDSNHEIYTAKLYSNYFLNSLFSWEKHIKQDPLIKKDVTAIGKDANNVYVGVRDGFRNVKEINDDIPLVDGSDTIPDPFITRFVQNEDKLLICTLNDGLFEGKDNHFSRFPNSNIYTFIRDLSIDKSVNDNFVLTNRYLLKQADGTFVQERSASGYNRIFVIDSTHIFGLKNYGLTNFCDSTDYFVDIQFNPVACVALNNKIYTGSSNGIYAFSSLLNKEDGIEKGFETITIVDKNYFSRANILIFTLILLIIILALWWYDRCRMGKKALQTFRDGLVMRLNELKSVKERLNIETIERLDTLWGKVINIDIAGREKSLALLRENSLKIMDLTSNVSSFMIYTLNSQLEEIKKCRIGGFEHKVKDTTETIMNHTLLGLANQIQLNSLWLDNVRRMMDILSDYETLTKELPLIAGVTEEIKMILKTSSKTPEQKIEKIEMLIRSMNDDAVVEKIRIYIDRKIGECCNLQTQESGKESLLPLIVEGYTEMKEELATTSKKIDFLRRLSSQDRQLSMEKTIISIRQLLKQYNLIFSILQKKEKESKQRQNEGDYVLDESLRHQDREKLKELKEQLENNSNNILNLIDQFYRLCTNTERNLLESIGVKLKSSDGQFLTASVLVVLITHTDIPISRFAGLFTSNEQSIRRAKRNLLISMSAHKNKVLAFAEAQPTGIAAFLLDVTEMTIE